MKPEMHSTATATTTKNDEKFEREREREWNGENELSHRESNRSGVYIVFNEISALEKECKDVFIWEHVYW